MGMGGKDCLCCKYSSEFILAGVVVEDRIMCHAGDVVKDSTDSTGSAEFFVCNRWVQLLNIWFGPISNKNLLCISQ